MHYHILCCLCFTSYTTYQLTMEWPPPPPLGIAPAAVVARPGKVSGIPGRSAVGRPSRRTGRRPTACAWGWSSPATAKGNAAVGNCTLEAAAQDGEAARRAAAACAVRADARLQERRRAAAAEAATQAVARCALASEPRGGRRRRACNLFGQPASQPRERSLPIRAETFFVLLDNSSSPRAASRRVTVAGWTSFRVATSVSDIDPVRYLVYQRSIIDRP